MQTAKEAYRRADKAISLLNKRAIKRFESAKAKANLAHFDELTVLQTVKRLYKDLESDNEEVFLDLAKEEYSYCRSYWSLDGEQKKPDRKWLLALLAAYNAVTKYVYLNEVTRKRDYTAEGVIASSAKAAEFRRGLSYWAQFTAQAAEDVTDEATLKAFHDAGITYVRWITQEDEKVCEECKERGGVVYPINNIPPKPHRRCRCHFEPVRKK